ncbi:hypothetical protein [Dialister succinatiphilus]|uniref:hypothetical protein n=1 Tax=Dialister succinatiphilus TaxID=487173 RepID=UPI003F8141A8
MDRRSLENFAQEITCVTSTVSLLAGMIAASFADSRYILMAIIVVTFFFFCFWGAHEGGKFYDQHKHNNE